MARNHFRVTFRCKGFNEPLAIQIHLTDDFPESAPKISVDRKYSHHLLDDNGVVTKLPELQKWSIHSDLGSIVQKITNNFNVSSPTIKQNFPANFQQPGVGGGGGAQPNAQWVCIYIYIYNVLYNMTSDRVCVCVCCVLLSVFSFLPFFLFVCLL